MKKATYTLTFLLLGVICLFSCKKVYHCSCTYNNTVMYNADLDCQFQNNAQNECSSHDSTITGEAWKCTIY